VIPPEFEYTAPESLDAALSALRDGGEDAKVLAGGHSLLPLMKLRLAAPTLLVDLRRVPGLRGTSREDGTWKIGALTRHADLQGRDELGPVGKAAALDPAAKRSTMPPPPAAASKPIRRRPSASHPGSTLAARRRWRSARCTW